MTDDPYGIYRRPAQRLAHCRGCDDDIEKGEEMVTIYSFWNRVQHIHFCLPCAELIGKLARD